MRWTCCGRQVFAIPTSQSSFHTTKAPRILPLRRTPKRRKGQPREPAPARWWVAPWAGWRASAHWRFRAWDHSSRRVRLWLLLPARVSEEPLEASRERCSEWAFPSSKPNVTKAGSRKVASCFRSTAITPTGPRRQRKFWNAAERRKWRRQPRRARIFPRATDLCHARASWVRENFPALAEPLLTEGFSFA